MPVGIFSVYGRFVFEFVLIFEEQKIIGIRYRFAFFFYSAYKFQRVFCSFFIIGFANQFFVIGIYSHKSHVVLFALRIVCAFFENQNNGVYRSCFKTSLFLMVDNCDDFEIVEQKFLKSRTKRHIEPRTGNNVSEPFSVFQKRGGVI